MLNLERLRALHAVAETGSVAAAARALHVTPSGISQQLNKLEREVGVPLLAPQGRGVRLTEAGWVLARRTGEVLSVLAQAEAEIASLQSEVTGRLRVGALVSPSRTVLPRAIAEIKQNHPRLEITFHEGESEELLPALIRRDLDIVVVDSWSTAPVELPDGISFIPVHDDVVVAALPASHPLADNKIVALSDLSDQAWATWTPGTDFHAFTVRMLRSQGFDPRIEYEVAEFPAQVEFVAQGLAVALIPRLARVVPPEGVRMLDTIPPLGRSIYLAWRTDSDRPAVRAAIEALRRQFDALDGQPLNP
ncbi:LysR family transcriptional regulator [Rhodococcus sp. IEGM 1379]|uniref:LysR family transcriptional regulator n=1 Tax=Rhodococcus sp. IEGM 1379 TaxID=3047086 RepID=UPI0024B6A801|nr:LysR family transcriptional regulator [Rhodococcus sp. IEGM 1379]MDI9916973.1 LysR family transcriptional regulator [Rhodococcus sp. IEGM 1379]